MKEEFTMTENERLKECFCTEECWNLNCGCCTQYGGHPTPGASVCHAYREQYYVFLFIFVI